MKKRKIDLTGLERILVSWWSQWNIEVSQEVLALHGEDAEEVITKALREIEDRKNED